MKKSTCVEPALDDFIRIMADLARRRDLVLEQPELDLSALSDLAGECEAAGLACAAAGLRRRLEWYRTKYR